MFLKLISSINWIDLLIIGFAVRIVYIGIKNGFVTELFKLAGVLCAIFITFHYYINLAQFLHHHIAVAESALKVICFAFLLSIVLVLFKLIREGTMLIFKVQAHPLLDQWGGFATAILRSILISSLILVSLQIVEIEYLQKNARKSFFHPYLLNLSPNFYKACYAGLISKFFPNERLNPVVFKLEDTKSIEDSKK